MRWSWIAVPAAAFCLFVNPISAGADVFTGAWTVNFTPDQASSNAGAKLFKDAALFHNGELSSEAFGMYGFTTVVYTVNETDANIFTATMTSQTQGTLQWVGRRDGGKVSGILLWTKPNGSVHRYTLSGEPMNEPDTGD